MSNAYTPAAIAAGAPNQPEELAELDLTERLRRQEVERKRQAEVIEAGRREGDVLEALMRGGTHISAPDGTVTFLGTDEDRALLEHPAPGSAEAAAAERRRVLAEQRLRVQTAEEVKARQMAEARWEPLPTWLVDRAVELTSTWAAIVARGSWLPDGRWLPSEEDDLAGADLLPNAPGHEVALTVGGRVMRMDTEGISEYLPCMIRLVVGQVADRSVLERVQHCPSVVNTPLRWPR